MDRMSYVFITGSPRSGTGWMANYLSYGNVMVTHDVNPIAMKSVYDASGAYVTGNSGPENAPVRACIDMTYPGAKWVYIMRDSKKACDKIGIPHFDVKPKAGDIEIDFKDLFNSAEEIARVIYSEWECPKWRQDLLKGLNVQTNLDNELSKYYVPQEILYDQVSDFPSPVKQEYKNHLNNMFNGNANVLAFLDQAGDIAELFKAISEHKPINVEKAKKVLIEVTTQWPNNPVLAQHASIITSSLSSCFERYINKDVRKHCPIDVDLVSALSYIAYGAQESAKHMVKVRELATARYKELSRWHGSAQ